MTPQARVQAAIDILDQTIHAAQAGGAAADTIVARYFAGRRYAGSKDRRAIRDLVYAAIRRAGALPENGRAAMVGLAREDSALAALFDGSGHGPAPILPDEPGSAAGVAPEWLMRRLEASGTGVEEARALIDRAPLDLRVNALRADISVLDTLGAEPIAGLPLGGRLPSGTAIEATPAFRDGLVEVQDAGSQMVAGASRAEPGQTVIDLCAGAGGKTLALAAAMDDRGRIIAADVDRARLQRFAPRAERAGVTIAETVLLNPGREAESLSDWEGRADCVLIDAPCSGVGTWRRNPEARWRLTPARLDRLTATQAHLLEVGAALVRPGGALIHIVCSLLDAEGAGQVDRFLSAHPDWAVDRPIEQGRPHGAGRRLTPAHDGTDGFFVARLIRPC